MLKLRLINKDELTNLSEKLRKSKETDFEKSFGERSGWATDILEAKTGPYPRSEGAYLATIISKDGDIQKIQPWSNAVGIRPAVTYSEIKELGKDIGEDENGILCLEYGEYPQSKVDVEKSFELTQALEKGILKETEKTYSILNKKPRMYSGLPLCFGGYIVDEKKPVIELKEYKYKDGKKYVLKDNVWYNVEPIVWQVDKQNDIALTKNIINNGLLYSACSIKEFIEQYLSKDIIPLRRSKVKVTKVNIGKVNELMNLNQHEVGLETSKSQKVKKR